MKREERSAPVPLGTFGEYVGETLPRPPAVPVEWQKGRAPAVSGVAPSSNSGVDITLDVDEQGSSRTAFRSLPPPLAWFSRYGILGRLAVGGMAEIFLGREEIAGDAARHLIVKVLRAPTRCSPEEEAYFEALFLREGRVAMQLSHPNICHTYEFGKWGGHFFIAMEWVEGLTLRAILDRLARGRQRLPQDVAVYLTCQVAAALDHAHSARDTQRRPLGVVHRDVTPHNIMLRHDGIVKLLDFGVAKVAEAEEPTGPGKMQGKLGYMAPEQCAGRSLDGRADVFALGVCLFEMLSGRRLYRRNNQAQVLHAILEEPVPSLSPHVPEALERIVRRALSKNPLDRFDTAGDLQDALIGFAVERGFVMSATRARRWLEQVYGEELFQGPTLEVGASVVEQLAAKADHAPLSSSVPPPLADLPAQGETRANLSQTRWWALAGVMLVSVALWMWWWMA